MPSVADLVAQIEERKIRERIKVARKEAGLTQEQIADLLGVIPRTYQNYERADDDGRTPWSMMNAIAAATGRSQEWLLHGDLPSMQEFDPHALASQIISEVKAELMPLTRRLADMERDLADLSDQLNRQSVTPGRDALSLLSEPGADDEGPVGPLPGSQDDAADPEQQRLARGQTQKRRRAQ